jgi:flagellar hook assembly protein FlgD
MYSKQQVPAHKWSYVAGTYDGKDLKLYINGQLDRTMHVDKQLVTKGNTDVFIGKRGNSGKNEAHYKGLLDEVRVYNRALTPGQIKQHQALNYDKLSLDQAKDGERWAVAVTANNGKEISKTTMSNSVIVEKVQQADDPSDKTSVSYNYPNPFHASTKFKLKLSKKQHVSIKVYNVLGRLVYTKFEGNKSKGPHIIKIDGNKLNLASGVYFCRFAMDDKVITQKMTYIK